MGPLRPKTLTNLVGDHPALSFFVLVYTLTLPWWVLARFVELDGLPDNLPITDVGATFMPMMAAVFLTARRGGVAAVRRLLLRLFDWNRIASNAWLAVIVLLMPSVYIVAHAFMLYSGYPAPERWSLSPWIALAFVSFFFAAAGEEIGYTAYATDILQKQFSALTTALFIGVPWALWHLPSMLQLNQAPRLIAWGLAVTLAYRIIYIWLYNNNRSSVFAVVLFHAIANTGRTAFPGGRSTFELGDAAIGYGLIIAIAVAVTVVWGPKTLTRA